MAKRNIVASLVPRPLRPRYLFIIIGLGMRLGYGGLIDIIIINPRRACARVTVLGLSDSGAAPRAIRRTNSTISDFNAIRA